MAADPVTAVASVIEQVLLLINSKNAEKWTKEHIELESKIAKEWVRKPYTDMAKIEEWKKRLQIIQKGVALEVQKARQG